MDLGSTMGFLFGAVLVFVTFCTKEEEYPLETSTDDRCFFSSEITDGLVTRSFARSYRFFTISVLLIEGGVNHTLSIE